MPKIEDVGVGKYIRNPRRGKNKSGDVPLASVLRIEANDGNAFRCHTIKRIDSTRVTIDSENYQFIPIGTNVEQVTI